MSEFNEYATRIRPLKYLVIHGCNDVYCKTLKEAIEVAKEQDTPEIYKLLRCYQKKPFCGEGGL